MGRIYFRYIDRQIKDDRKLINSVKFYPSIYDVSDPFYNNGFERGKIWEVIAKNLQSTARMCEERWNKLVDMYKSKSFSLHIALIEILDQFLNIHPEAATNNDCFLKATDSEEQINFEKIINSGLVDKAYSSLPVEYRYSVDEELTGEVCTSPTDDYTFVQSFFVTEDALEFYEDFPHSL